MEQADRTWSDRKLERIAKRITETDVRLNSLAFFLEPSEWAEQNISFERDISANFDRFDLSLTPYLRDVINTWNFKNTIRETTVVAPEQTGKSLSWIIGLLYSFVYNPCLSMIIYPSDEKGIRINKEKLEPLMREIPKLAAELEMPRSQKQDCYQFSNLKCYFSGAGSRVTSQSSKIRIADEVDDWVSHEEKVTNLQDLRKRARSFSESMLFKVCSPTSKTGEIWTEFNKGSKGFWYLRCKGCGKLTMRSADIFNMQWELDENHNVISDSIVLVCPECKFEHKESDRRDINISGAYIHENPGLIGTLPSFQWGALASQWGGLLSWPKIAEAQLLAGKSGSFNDQRYLDNSIRGLPFLKRTYSDGTMEKLKTHVVTEEIPINDFEGIFYAGDTQDDRIFYIIAGIDSKSNLYILKAAQEPILENIRTEIEKDFYGRKILAAVQDEGGHRTLEIQKFAQTIPNLWTYKGNNRQAKRIERGTGKLLLVKESAFRTESLYYIHNQEKKDNNYLFLAKDLPEEFYTHLLAYQQDNAKKFGDEYENWTHNGRKHDYFDCMKMLYALIEFCKAKYPKHMWYKGTSDWMKSKQVVKLDKGAPNYSNFVQTWRNKL